MTTENKQIPTISKTISKKDEKTYCACDNDSQAKDTKEVIKLKDTKTSETNKEKAKDAEASK